MGWDEIKRDGGVGVVGVVAVLSTFYVLILRFCHIFSVNLVVFNANLKVKIGKKKLKYLRVPINNFIL